MLTLYYFAVYEVKTRYYLQVRKGLPLTNGRDSMPHLLSWRFVLVFQFAQWSPEVSKVCVNNRNALLFSFGNIGDFSLQTGLAVALNASLIPIGIGRNPGGIASSYLIFYFSLHFVSIPYFIICAVLFTNKSMVSSDVSSIGWLLLPLFIFQCCLQATVTEAGFLGLSTCVHCVCISNNKGPLLIGKRQI